MDQELTELAAVGARTIVSLMATDTWHAVRDKVVRIFARQSDAPGQQVYDELETSHDRIISAADSSKILVEREEQDRWEAQLRLSLIDYPETASLIARFIEVASEKGIAASTINENVSLNAHAKDNSRIFQQGHGVQYNK